MRSVLFCFFIVFGFSMVLYLSWLYEPTIGSSWFIPSGLARWVDAGKNDTLRTGVPFIFIGLLAGFWLLENRKLFKTWLLFWFLMIIIVLIAETGQIFLPLRSFDWMDVAWGAIGAAFGLGTAYILWGIWKLMKILV